MKQEQTGAALVFLAAVCFGLIAIFVKLAYAGQVNMITSLSVRFILASIFMWAVILLTGQAISLNLKEMGSLFIVSLLGYGGAGTFYFAALKTIPPSLASLLMFTHPILVTLYELVFYRYPVTNKKVIALMLSTTGIIMVLGNIGGNVSINGILMGLAAGVSYAAYLLYGNKSVQGHHPLVTTTFVLTFAGLGFTLYGLASRGINLDFPLSSWVWLLAMALISTCLGILSLFAGLKRINAGKASIIGTFELVVTVCLSALFFGDILTVLQIVGGTLILAGIITLQLKKQKSNSLLHENRSV